MNLKPLRPDQQQKPPTRWNYHQNSKDFIHWVNKLGIERTWIGRMAHSLDANLQVRKLTALFIFSLLISFLISWDLDISYSRYKEGDLATNDVRSPVSFEVVDGTETNHRRIEAEESIPPVYDYDVELYDQLIDRVHSSFRNMRAAMAQARLRKGPGAKQNLDEFLNRQTDFESALGGIHISKDNFAWLVRQKFQPLIELDVARTLERWGNQKIVEDVNQLHEEGRKRVIINTLERGIKDEEFMQDTSSLLDTTEVRRRLVSQAIYPGFYKTEDITELNDLTRSLIIPNLTLNKRETETRRERARDSVVPFIVQVHKGQNIVRSGEPVQKIQVTMLEELERLKKTRHQDFVSLVTAIFLVILLVVYFQFLSRFTTRVVLSNKDAVAIGLIIVVEVTIMKFMLWVANVAFVDKFTSVPASFYVYLLPVSFGAMMVGLLIPYGEVVWLFSMFTAVIAGLVADQNFIFMVISFTASIVAARGVFGCKKREDLYWAGIKTGLVTAGLAFFATLMSKPNPAFLRPELLWNTPAAFISGLFSCFIALTLVPFWETFFVYTTDVKLLELSNLNHPLLKELIVKAPGTYHHSLIVGSMCEAAAEGIGANPLLAKVCAYYHDIGKTDHAQYFIENQRPGENRHDQISPGMSKTILIAHVKDGVEKGLKYKLGQSIIDVIEQHHGTTLISFFYHKAKQSEDSDMHEVSEDEYRYPGPKPQFREGALCMLADSIEAAARSLDEPTPARLQNIVHNIVQKKFLDGQLDECNLTLKDLTVIEEAFARILLGIYHQRIDYPTAPKSANKKPVQGNFTAS